MAPDDLLKIAAEMESLLPLFAESRSGGQYLDTGRAGQFTGLLARAKSIIEGELGLGNPFNSDLVNIKFFKQNSTMGGPSYAGVSEAAHVVRAAEQELRRKQGRPASTAPGAPPFIDPSHVSALATLGGGWDFTRLIALCIELNKAAAGDQHIAMAALQRAILDHVPPLFQCKNFTEVTSNYGGGGSFKEQMGHLDNSLRKVADDNLHTKIRASEAVPTGAEVDFGSGVNALLAEVIRITPRK